jgi:hypothetical protein
MKQKSMVTVSKYWNNPKITTEIWLEGIQLTKDLDDFKESLKYEVGKLVLDAINNRLKGRVNALKGEVGSPIFYITKKSIGDVIDKVLGQNASLDKEELYKIFDEAFDSIINKIKEESAKVV